MRNVLQRHKYVNRITKKEQKIYVNIIYNESKCAQKTYNMLDIVNRSYDVPKKCHEGKGVPPRLLYKKNPPNRGL